MTVKKRVHTQVFFWLGLSIFLSMLMAEKVLAKDNWYHFELIVFEQTMPNTETFEGKLAAIKLPRKHFDLTYTTFPKSLLLIKVRWEEHALMVIVVIFARATCFH